MGSTKMKKERNILLKCRFALTAVIASLSAAPVASYADIPCGGDIATQTTGVMPTTSIQGNTPQEIHAQFASIIESNFRTGNAEKVIQNLSAKELNDLATRYRIESKVGTSPLLAIMATRLSDTSLVKIASAFGRDDVQAAVNTYASAEVKAAVTPELAVLPTASMVTPMAAPTVDMTIQEIYLEFRTAPLGSLSVGGALSETAMFAGKDIAAAWWVGDAIGTQLSNAIQEYDPALDDAIGGTVSGMVNQIQGAANDVQQGELLKGVDDLFNGPVWGSGDYSGDYDDFIPLLDYHEVYVGGGGCV
jgi:hypothetical protein